MPLPRWNSSRFADRDLIDASRLAATSPRPQHDCCPLAALPHPEQTLLRIKRQEALRHRGRPQFSVVIVDVGPPFEGPDVALRLVQVFQRRARVGDEIGWLAADRIAMILPLTGEEGARQFADEVCSGLGGEHRAPGFEVFTA